MADEQQGEQQQATMDMDNLFREDVFTDQKVGTIRRLTPVDADGEPVSGKEVLFYGQAQMMTPGGAMPLNFQLHGGSLSEAASQFPEAAQQSMQETMKEIEEYRRQQASSIVVPGQEGGDQGGGSPGGGKIQFR